MKSLLHGAKGFSYIFGSMKKLLLYSTLFISVACSNQKESATSTETNSENYRVIGKVHVGNECHLYIETQLKDKMVNFYPINLDDKYKNEGMKLKFDYTISNENAEEACSEMPAILLNDVTLMR